MKLQCLVLGIIATANSSTIPVQTGRYGVGISQYVIPHITTNDPIAPDKRSDFYLLSMYYPTLEKSNVTRPYFDPATAQIYTDVYNYTTDALKSLTTPLQPNAEPVNTTLPTVILSAGAAVNSYNYYYELIGDLASLGYPVAAIDHPYELPALLLPNGTTIIGLDILADWSIDLATTVYNMRVGGISNLLDIYPFFTFQNNLPFNTTHFVAMGHSLGGAAAAGVLTLPAKPNVSVLGGINMDGSFYEDLNVHKPFLMMASDGHTADGDSTWATFPVNQTGWLSVLGVNGTGHNDYSDIGLWNEMAGLPGKPPSRSVGPIAPLRMVQIIRRYVCSMIDFVIGNTDAGKVFVQPSPNWPEVVFVNASRKAGNSGVHS